MSRDDEASKAIDDGLAEALARPECRRPASRLLFYLGFIEAIGAYSLQCSPECVTAMRMRVFDAFAGCLNQALAEARKPSGIIS